MTSYRDAGLPRFEDHVVTANENRSRVAKLRQKTPLALGLVGPVVLRSQRVNELLRDTRLRGPGMDMARLSGIPEGGKTWQRLEQIFLFMEGEEHHHYRRLVARAFTAGAIERLRPVARSTMTTLLDRVIHDGRADAVPALCEPLPAPVISALIGIDRPDDLARWASMLLMSMRIDAGLHLARIEETQAELDDYLAGVIAERKAHPRDDLLSVLLHPTSPENELTETQLLSAVSGLLIAGTRGVTNQLANIIHTFATQPRAWRQLQRDPALVPGAVEEAIRWEPASEGVVRCPMEDIEIDGHVIPAGTLVVLSSLSANQDPEVVEDGDRFDIRRAPPEGWQLLTFGGGIHYCLGAQLARMELSEALSVLLERLETLQLAGDPLPNPPGAAFSRGYTSLPIRWAERSPAP
jgi:cytochrome P450